MISSVLTFKRSNRATSPVSVVKGSIHYTPYIHQCCCVAALMNVSITLYFSDIDKMTSDGGSCSHGRANQVRASSTALSSLIVPVAGQRAALTLGLLMPIHCDT